MKQSQVIQKDLQAKIDKDDNRIKVKNIFQHPFHGIGRIECKIKNQKGQYVSSYGTAGIIGRNLIITSAHVIYNSKLQSFAQNIIFQVPYKKDGETQSYPIRVKNYTYNKRYIGQNSATRPPLDYAILQLQPNQVIQQKQILKINFDYDYQKQKKSPIHIPGFRYLHQNIICFEQRQAFKQQEKQFLQYKHTTDGGYSGGPIMVKSQKSNQYQIIGIHKGTQKNYNYCLLLSSLNKQQQQFANHLIKSSKYPQNWQKVQTQISKQNSQQSSELTNKIKELQQKLNIQVPKLDQKIKQFTKIIQNMLKQIRQVPKVIQVEKIVEKLVQVQKIVQVQSVKNHLLYQLKPVEVIVQKLVPVQKTVQSCVFVDRIIQKIVVIREQVPKVVQVQKIVQKIVERVQYISASDNKKNIQIRYQIVDRIVQKPIPIIQKVQKIIQVPQINQKIVQLHTVIQKPVQVPVIVQKLVQKQVVMQIQKILNAYLIKNNPVQLIKQKLVFVPSISEVVKMQKQKIQTPLLQIMRKFNSIKSIVPIA